MLKANFNWPLHLKEIFATQTNESFNKLLRGIIIKGKNYTQHNKLIFEFNVTIN